MCNPSFASREPWYLMKPSVSELIHKKVDARACGGDHHCSGRDDGAGEEEIEIGN